MTAPDRKLCPREPTEAMMQAAYEDWNNHSGAGQPRSAAEGMRAKWRAMFDAAPVAAAEPAAIRLTPSQARDIVAAWGGDEDEDNRVVVQERAAWDDDEGDHHEAGLYLHFEEYPEEGVMGPLGADQPASTLAHHRDGPSQEGAAGSDADQQPTHGGSMRGFADLPESSRTDEGAGPLPTVALTENGEHGSRRPGIQSGPLTPPADDTDALAKRLLQIADNLQTTWPNTIRDALHQTAAALSRMRDAEHVRNDAVASMRECEARMRTAEAEVAQYARTVEKLVNMHNVLRSEVADLVDERNQLRAKLEAAQTDAARYQWLKPRLFSIDFDYSDSHASVLVFEAPIFPLGPGLALDAAIDAAIKGSKT